MLKSVERMTVAWTPSSLRGAVPAAAGARRTAMTAMASDEAAIFAVGRERENFFERSRGDKKVAYHV